MWIPSDITSTICFLCVDDNGRKLYGGTAFFVMKQEVDCTDLKWGYLVTAEHCVRKAFQNYSNLFYRVNLKGEGVKFVALPHPDSKWLFAENSDVAVLPIKQDDTTEMRALSSDMFLTDALAQKEGIGLGDEVFIIGLFKEVYGKKTNFPILRSGMIASMPTEPFQDKDTGNDYRAFLIEARSIGGLSGSPVFMALKKRGVEMHPAHRGFHAMTHSMLLVGIIRGHWDSLDEDNLTDFVTGTMEKLNTGIAIVTPIQDVERVLMCNELRKSRRAEVRDYQKKHAPTLRAAHT